MPLVTTSDLFFHLTLLHPRRGPLFGTTSQVMKTMGKWRLTLW